MKKLFLLIFFAASNIAFIAKAEEPDSTALKIVTHQVEAFNQHDINEYLKNYSDSIKIYIYPDSLILVGKNKLRQIYKTLFSNVPELQKKIIATILTGNYVIMKEEQTGFPDADVINSVVIYEVKNKMIVTVWYLSKDERIY